MWEKRELHRAREKLVPIQMHTIRHFKRIRRFVQPVFMLILVISTAVVVIAIAVAAAGFGTTHYYRFPYVSCQPT